MNITKNNKIVVIIVLTCVLEIEIRKNLIFKEYDIYMLNIS